MFTCFRTSALSTLFHAAPVRSEHVSLSWLLLRCFLNNTFEGLFLVSRLIRFMLSSRILTELISQLDITSHHSFCGWQDNSCLAKNSKPLKIVRKKRAAKSLLFSALLKVQRSPPLSAFFAMLFVFLLGISSVFVIGDFFFNFHNSKAKLY